MNRILRVAQREYIEAVKTKTFIVSVLMTPVLIGVIIFFTSRLSLDAIGPRPPRSVAVTDLTGRLADHLEVSFDRYNEAHPQRPIVLELLPPEPDLDALLARAKQRVRQGEWHAYAVMEEGVVDGDGKVRLYTHSKRAADIDISGTIDRLLTQPVVDMRCALRDLSPALLAEIRYVPVEQLAADVGPASQDTRMSEIDQVVRMMVPFFFMFLMLMGIFGTGQQMLSSVIEEKSSRVIEMLLSALTPFQFMAGKILGLAAIGLTVITIWSVPAVVVLGLQGINLDLGAALPICFVIYYILGFLLFSSILGALGSICNTIKEAQSLMMPMSLILVLPMVAWFNIAQNPDAAFAQILSYVPPITPMVMILRISASPQIAAMEVVATILLLAASVPVAMWMAAKVFRTGVFMYGKRPALREVLRWLGEK